MYYSMYIYTYNTCIAVRIWYVILAVAGSSLAAQTGGRWPVTGDEKKGSSQTKGSSFRGADLPTTPRKGLRLRAMQ